MRVRPPPAKRRANKQAEGRKRGASFLLEGRPSLFGESLPLIFGASLPLIFGPSLVMEGCSFDGGGETCALTPGAAGQGETCALTPGESGQGEESLTLGAAGQDEAP